MCGPFSRTVTSSRGSIRLARDAAVNPAALPPMMTIFTIHLQILFSRFDPRIRVGFACSLDEPVVFVFADLHTVEARRPDHIVKLHAREGRSHGSFHVPA